MKKTYVELDLNFYELVLPEERVTELLDPLLQWDGSGTSLGDGARDLNYVGKLTEKGIAEVRQLVRKMRRWKGINGISFHIDPIWAKPHAYEEATRRPKRMRPYCFVCGGQPDDELHEEPKKGPQRKRRQNLFPKLSNTVKGLTRH